MKKKFKCPLCKEEKAYISKAYYDLVVCRCNDGILKEVGDLDKGIFIPKIPNNTEINNFIVTDLIVNKIEDENKLDFLNKTMNKKFSSSYIKKFLNENDLYSVKDTTVNEILVFCITNNNHTYGNSKKVFHSLMDQDGKLKRDNRGSTLIDFLRKKNLADEWLDFVQS